MVTYSLELSEPRFRLLEHALMQYAVHFAGERVSDAHRFVESFGFASCEDLLAALDDIRLGLSQARIESRDSGSKAT